MDPLTEMNETVSSTEPVPLAESFRDLLMSYAEAAIVKPRFPNTVRIGPAAYDRAKESGLLKVLEVRFPELTVTRA